MISRLQGVVLSRAADRVEIETKGGVVYEVEVPLFVLQRLPAPGGAVELRTLQVVTDSSASLYGFVDALERTLFQRLLTASGVGARLALAMMSTYTAERLARALLEKDTAALQQVSGIGRKKAEKIALDLSDKVADLAIITPSSPGQSSGAQEAVKALVALGYTFGDADRAVRGVLESGAPKTTEDLIRQALAG
ncbi:MAG: Holliday junction branch migration protein RuvA [Gemmatimonadetes bacterium]|nr:Holliday junction branch migration protein RuvA [Gemmatimonadota bacterium]MDA1103102.1 Holliday junction branch migration protein RuvA [Gemmatimonadota bacterium]